MHIVFGLHLDGLQPRPSQTAAGTATLGPRGLIEVLETQLGLPAPDAHPSESAFVYLRCLREATSPQRFFHRSLEVDPVDMDQTRVPHRTTHQPSHTASVADPLPWRHAVRSPLSR